MFNSNLSDQDVFEVVSLKFIEEVGIEEQAMLMTQLNDFLNNFEGFKSRDFYYSAEMGRWIDFVVWSDLKCAKKASEAIMNDEKAGMILSKMDEKSMIFSHYKRVGGAKRI